MRESELYVSVDAAVPTQGRLPACQGSGCLERARFVIVAESFVYTPAVVKTLLLRARFCEKHLRKSAPPWANQFVDGAIFKAAS
jgi:hypothetical protein